jgi:hypothetical protein
MRGEPEDRWGLHLLSLRHEDMQGVPGAKPMRGEPEDRWDLHFLSLTLSLRREAMQGVAGAKPMRGEPEGCPLGSPSCSSSLLLRSRRI